MSSNPFQKRREEIFNLKALRERRSITTMPDAIPVQQRTTICPKCGHALTLDELEANLHVCRCGYHFPIGSHYRLQLTMDPGTIREIAKGVKPFDWLHFPGYPEKLKAQRKKSGSTEGVSAVRGKIGGYPVVVAAMDTRFFMGSMGSAVGERITQAIELAERKKWPLILFCASGGARMQEGIISLMQMAKTSAVSHRADPPNHRRCHSQLRDARRHHPRRTRRADRLRRPPRHRTDHRRKAAGRFSARGIPAGTRFCRSNRPPAGHAQDVDSDPAPARPLLKNPLRFR